MPRRMADENFRSEQWQRRYEEHIRPINQFVEELRSDSMRGQVPYVAPMYGGVKARLLSVLRDPGPKTQYDIGSGFLSMENDDPTAEAMSNLFSGVGIYARDIVPWNVYPWYINRAPRAAELEIGVEPLKRIIELLPRLKVVILHGGSAQDSWRRLLRRYPTLMVKHQLQVISTYHTSRQAFWHPTPEVREARKEHLRASFKEAAQHLR